MLSNISQERRHVVKRAIMDHVEVSKKARNELFVCNNIKYSDKPAKSTKEIAGQLFQEYLQDTSMHGLKYLGNSRIKSGIFGKLFWIAIMICSFAFLNWMLWKFWVRYTTNPTRTIVDVQSPTFLIPFPAVTICPLIPPLVERRIALLKNLRLPDNMDNKTAMFLLRYGPSFANEYSPGGKEYVDKLETLLKINHMTLVDFIKALRPCEDMMEACWWDNTKMNCSEIFKISYTFTGICCSFNYLLDDYIENGRTKVNESDFLKTLLFGSRTGLTVILHRKLLFEDDGTGDRYIKFSTNSVGIVIFSHHPLEYVSNTCTRQILQSEQELRLSVIPSTTQKLKGYYHRNTKGELVLNCADENTKLKYFPTYHYTNCFISCSIEAVYQACGCVPFSYTPIAKKYSLRICEWGDFRCLYANANNTRIIQNVDRKNFTCTCNTPCQSIYYKIRTSTLWLNGDQSFNVLPTYRHLTKAQAILKVFMGADSFVALNTIPIADELYLLASIGGIFSLFVGCSFLTVVELFYFIGLFFRSYSNSKKSK